MSAPPAAGWYRDPTGKYSSRYWDGSQWSSQVNSGGSNAVDAVSDDIRFVPPAPGTEVQRAAAAPPAPSMQVTQSAPRSSVGTIVAIVLGIIAIILVIAVLLNLSGDETDPTTPATEPPATEAPATTEAPAG